MYARKLAGNNLKKAKTQIRPKIWDACNKKWFIKRSFSFIFAQNKGNESVIFIFPADLKICLG